MPLFKTCVIYTAQYDYTIYTGTLEQAAQITEAHFKARPPEYVTQADGEVTEEGASWHHFQYLGTVQELAGQEKVPRRENPGLCPNCGAETKIVFLDSGQPFEVCDVAGCGWEATDKDPAEEAL